MLDNNKYRDEDEVLNQLNVFKQEVDKGDNINLKDLKIKKGDIRQQQEIIGENETRVKFQNFMSSESTISTNNLYTYFCALCGQHLLTLGKKLNQIQTRKTDRAFVIDQNKIFTQKYLTEDKIQYIKRAETNKIECQYRWKCSDCGIWVAYQSYPHSYDYKQKKDLYLYIIKDATVSNSNYSQLLKYVSKYKTNKDKNKFKDNNE